MLDVKTENIHLHFQCAHIRKRYLLFKIKIFIGLGISKTFSYFKCLEVYAIFILVKILFTQFAIIFHIVRLKKSFIVMIIPQNNSLVIL